MACHIHELARFVEGLASSYGDPGRAEPTSRRPCPRANRGKRPMPAPLHRGECASSSQGVIPFDYSPLRPGDCRVGIVVGTDDFRLEYRSRGLPTLIRSPHPTKHNTKHKTTRTLGRVRGSPGPYHWAWAGHFPPPTRVRGKCPIGVESQTLSWIHVAEFYTLIPPCAPAKPTTAVVVGGVQGKV